MPKSIDSQDESAIPSPAAEMLKACKTWFWMGKLDRDQVKHVVKVLQDWLTAQEEAA
jgi:hypothetical protein